MNGQNITFDVNGQPATGYLAAPAQRDAPGVIVLHAWWGLNSFFKSLCDKLASEGFVAFAPDLKKGKVATTIDEAKQQMPENESEQFQPIISAVPDFLRGRPEVSNEPLSVIGFSMGADWSLAMASERQDIANVVLFYGAYIHEGILSQIQANILGHFAELDEWEPLDMVSRVESDLRGAGLNPTFYIYPKTKHWFFENDRPEYDPEAADLAWRRTLEFLRR
jgi:carboxymethylenebutenolidase